MARLTYSLLFGSLLSIAMSGCGNKGPLYLPPAPVEQISTATAVPTAAQSTEHNTAPGVASNPDNTDTNGSGAESDSANATQ